MRCLLSSFTDLQSVLSWTIPLAVVACVGLVHVNTVSEMFTLFCYNDGDVMSPQGAGQAEESRGS